MQFRVSSTPVPNVGSLPTSLSKIERIPESEAKVTRVLTLNEYDNLYGKPMSMLLNGTRWHEPVTEKPELHTIEIWCLVNLTSDTHPIHIHQARFQILDRQAIDAGEYVKTRQLRYRGEKTPPEPGETGWKDTVRANGRSVTRIIIRFDGYPGRFVWHCHTLEHAANEMMRPFEIIGS
jgi:spore coat protein A, manganese oxidase